MIKLYSTKKIFAFFIFLNLITFISTGRTIYAISTTDGNWSTNGNWSLTGVAGSSCNCTPLPTDDVKIPAGYSITIFSGTPSCASLELNNNLETAESARLILTSSTSLTVNGNVLMNADTSLKIKSDAVHSINMNGGTITVNGNLTMLANRHANYKNHNQIIYLGTGGTLNVTGDINMFNNGADVEIWMNYTNTTINIGGNFYFGDIECDILNGNGSNGTINYNGSGNQTIFSATGPGIFTYHKLKVTNAGTKTPNGQINISNNLTISNSAILNAGTNSVGAGPATLTMTGGEFKIARSAISVVPELTGTYAITAGKVTLNGIEAQILRGETYFDIQIINTYATAPQITLNGNVTANGTVTLSSGLVALGGYNLTIGNSGNITGYAAPGSLSATYIVTNGSGGLIQNNLGSSGRSGAIFYPVGYSTTSYTPVTLNNSGTTDNFTVNISNNVYLTPPATGILTSGFINKTINISEAVLGGSTAAITIQWNTSDEMPVFNHNACYITHYTSSWGKTQTAGAASNSGPYYRTSTGITSFSPFTIESGWPLPIQLLSFNAYQNAGNVDLAWKTGAEINNDYFTIERSIDGITYKEILKIDGAGNSSETKSYVVTDNAPYEGTSYYKLKQTDFDGAFTYSDTKAITTKSQSIPTFNVFPNPSNGSDIYLRSNFTEKSKEILVIVYDALGKLKYSKVIPTDQGKVFTAIDPSEKLSPGIYYIVGSTEDELHLQKQKLVIQ